MNKKYLLILLCFSTLLYAGELKQCDSLFKDKKYREAKPYCEKEANEGSDLAQVALGLMYANGTGGVKQDYKLAFELYQKSANQGNAMALAFLSEFYFRGKGVEVDISKSKQLLESSCNKGFKNACTALKIYF